MMPSRLALALILALTPGCTTNGVHGGQDEATLTIISTTGAGSVALTNEVAAQDPGAAVLAHVIDEAGNLSVGERYEKRLPRQDAEAAMQWFSEATRGGSGVPSVARGGQVYEIQSTAARS